MAKWVNDDVLDASLDFLKTNATTLCLCSSQPSNRTDAITTFELAKKAITSSDFTGPSDGVSSGRRITTNAETNVPVDNSGNAQFVALVDSTRLLFVTTCTLKQMVAGDLVNFPAWDFTIDDPI